MGFLQTFIHPDRDEDPERTEVARAANNLQIGEFQLLQLAYRHWHGDEMPKQIYDTIFYTYMVEDQVPHWARHYARRINQSAELGGLDDSDPEFHRYDDEYVTHVPKGVQQFIIAVSLILFVVGGGLLVTHYTVKEGSSILPPYFEDESINPPATPTDLRGS